MKQETNFKELKTDEFVCWEKGSKGYDLNKLEQHDACYVDEEVTRMYYASVKRDHVGLWFPVTRDGIQDWEHYRKDVVLDNN